MVRIKYYRGVAEWEIVEDWLNGNYMIYATILTSSFKCDRNQYV